MRNPIENITHLQKQINDLQLENQALKNIMDRHGISYFHEIQRLRGSDKPADYDSDQGARIIHPKEITEAMANLFYARFWGRTDVYAKRYEKKSTGEAGYFPQCDNLWQGVCPKTHQQKIRCKDCTYQKYT